MTYQPPPEFVEEVNRLIAMILLAMQPAQVNV